MVILEPSKLGHPYMASELGHWFAEWTYFVAGTLEDVFTVNIVPVMMPVC